MCEQSACGLQPEGLDVLPDAQSDDGPETGRDVVVAAGAIALHRLDVQQLVKKVFVDETQDLGDVARQASTRRAAHLLEPRQLPVDRLLLIEKAVTLPAGFLCDHAALP